MRVAVVFFAIRPNSVVSECAKTLANGIQSQGHQVDLIDGFTEQNKKLVICQYVAIGTEQTSFLGKIHEKIHHVLASQAPIQGKKGFAFVVKKMAGSPRALLRLMAVMEKEGILIKNSNIIATEEEALEIGKNLHIDK